MQSRRTGAVLIALAIATVGATPTSAQPGSRYGDPLASYEVPSGIGYWKARRDRAELHRYNGDPASQAILRQQRGNLCRNVPEVC